MTVKIIDMSREQAYPAHHIPLHDKSILDQFYGPNELMALTLTLLVFHKWLRRK